ncbi:MAG TPA: hypothetical protein VI980_06335 [Acidimicrobiia bacterium]|nr:hypothetical protein [Acidimicrobiia bacterium]
MGAAADCESIGVGLLRQPVNSLTTLAFVVAGIVVMTRRRERRWVGIALIATGIGSFLFHGPMPTGGEWAHDLTLAWLLLVVAADGTRWERWSRIPSLVALGLLFALVPGVADPVALALAVLAVGSVLRADRSSATWAAVALLIAGAIFGRLGATTWPFCDPDSMLQLHGLWHLAAATAVTIWAISTPPLSR